MKKILVTGGAGFIGSHLVEKLLAENVWQVTVVDNFDDFYAPSIKRGNVAAFLKNPRFLLEETDICDAASLRVTFEKSDFDVIVHLAAKAGVGPSLIKPEHYVETNVQGTLNLLTLARDFNVKQFIFGSSSSVYGINCHIPFSENAEIRQPISPYAATKAAAELLCHTYSYLYGIRTLCLRFFTVYGARQRPDLAIHKFTRLIDENKPIEVFGDGTTKRDYTYIDDIIQGVSAAIEYDKTNFEIFNLGESHMVELDHLIELLEKNLNKKAIINRKPMQTCDVPQTFADITKSERLLGYRPQTGIEQGIRKFVDWFNHQKNANTHITEKRKEDLIFTPLA